LLLSVHINRIPRSDKNVFRRYIYKRREIDRGFPFVPLQRHKQFVTWISDATRPRNHVKDALTAGSDPELVGSCLADHSYFRRVLLDKTDDHLWFNGALGQLALNILLDLWQRSTASRDGPRVGNRDGP